MSIEIKQPSEGIEHGGTSLVLLNHLGSTVSQDTRRDAQFIADDFGITVVAADRPGTHGVLPSSRLARQMSSPLGYLRAAGDLGKDINTLLEKLEVENTIVVGRSAAGLGALALTASGTIKSQKAVFAAEPVACEPLSIEEAKQRVKDYGTYQKELQETNLDIVKPTGDTMPPAKKISRLGHMVYDYYYDRFHNEHIWASDASMMYARMIARYEPGVDATIEFAEHSLVAAPEVYDAVKAIQDKRIQGEAFVVKQTKHTTHASYDDREFMCDRLRPIMNRLVGLVD